MICCIHPGCYERATELDLVLCNQHRPRITVWQRRQLELVEDVEWMLETGESPLMIAHRLGYHEIRSLSRTLARIGRHDLARIFGRSTRLEAAA